MLQRERLPACEQGGVLLPLVGAIADVGGRGVDYRTMTFLPPRIYMPGFQVFCIPMRRPLRS